jgi:hypothetical protein
MKALIKKPSPYPPRIAIEHPFAYHVVSERLKRSKHGEIYISLKEHEAILERFKTKRKKHELNYQSSYNGLW